MMTIACNKNKFPLMTLATCALLSFMPLGLQAQQNEGEHSNYSPATGGPFFVLTDAQYGTKDEALLRVETPTSNGRETAAQYGGIDIALYRVPDPLGFLKAQKNLHRIDVAARPRDEGVANTLSYLWSNAWNKSRRAWRDIFSSKARRSVTETVPALKTSFAQPDYRPANVFKPLEGFDLVDRFRYPLMAAKPIDPLEKTQGVHLAGSSSNFLPKQEGNFYVPLGKLQPGLYIAEAMLGTRRATTLVFVSDTIAVTKLASNSLTAWTAHREDGRPVLGTRLEWTDGRGMLATATTDTNGLATFTHVSPERTYLLGQDAAGGVFVSENFYYDSEIHDTKLYTVTDRPLYRPGDEVQLKFLARKYHTANQSSPALAGGLDIVVLDSHGSPVWSGDARLMPDRGGDAMFRLPPDAPAGGYEIRVKYQDKTYGAAFRVAEYVKPHMEIAMTPDRANFKTGEPVSGTIHLTYPNGDPVKNAALDLTLRAQVLTMVQGELRYGGLFPVELTTASLTTDEQGEAKFLLPPAKEPSRLIISVLATDGAAYRVRKTNELLIERAATNWKLTSTRKFSLPGERMVFRLEPEDPEQTDPPVQWEIIRLEDQKKTNGPFDASTLEWIPTFDKPGSYSLLLRDAQGRLIAAAAHWVGGRDTKAQSNEAREIKVFPGTIEMVPDKERYQTGETAEVLMTFSDPVNEALLTLERDRVEASALLSTAQGKNAGWVSAERLTPNQWRARVPITENHTPNMTFSVAYVKAGEYVFQNAGLVVETPKLALDIKPGKTVVKPGETVEVGIGVSLSGKPTRAVLTVSVVDEMIYALQPEIAPDMVEFFQHIRRNNVRTSASLNFITYDEAINYANDATRQPPDRHQYNERGIKVLERARRDDTDTAAWIPALVTDENGRARFSFKMPDALSRWRITVRAVALDKESPKDKPAGQDTVYGQRSARMQSDNSLYAKWTSPNWMREGDTPVASLAVFNSTGSTREAKITLKLAKETITQKAALPQGVTWLSFKLPPFNGRQNARLEVRAANEAGKNELVDALETALATEPARWREHHEQTIALERGAASFQLPADARRLKLRLAANGSEHFLRIADSLLEYPWGCVEQTSSRLIPLSIITPLLSPDRAQGKAAHLWQALYSQRLRLAALAGPNAVFGWWGQGTDDNALMTSYAYYADWRAAHALDISLPASHWEHVLAVYREHAEKEPILHRTLSLWFIQQIGLPVRTQAQGLLTALAKTENSNKKQKETHDTDVASPLLSAPDSLLGLAYARVLAAIIAQEAGIASRPAPDNARQRLQTSEFPSARALLLLSAKGAKDRENTAARILADISEETPTFDRALALVWTQQALGGKLALQSGDSGLKPADGKWKNAAASPHALAETPEWLWPANVPLPKTLRINNAPARLTAILRFESMENGKSTLPVNIERKLYRLDRHKFKDGAASYALSPIDPAAGLSTQELYLDEIHLSSKQAHRYGIVEAPLPPGASIERTTWGINLIEDGKSSPIDRGKAEEHRNRYGVPVEFLPADGNIVVRHLLRVGQSGRFTLPPARYYQMYQPEKKAYAEEKNAIWVVK
ncbi:MAG: alpha-2-macroglobulin family protein [Betaproteobacteria bacterium]|nr:alpha-2-macroglobulin family protein [Betaproteobacteria bacterium]